MQSSQAVPFYIKTRRAFSPLRSYSWIVTVVIGIGGQFMPLLGLLIPFIGAAMLGLSIFKGRFWCGNICPHGSLFDNLIMPISRHTGIPGLLRSRGVIAAVLAFFIFKLGQNFITIYSMLDSADFYERTGLIFSSTYLMVLLVGGLLGVLINERTWCQFCPMGTLQILFYKAGKALGLATNSDQQVTVSRPELCLSCGTCARVCPLQLKPYLRFSENSQFDDEKCIRCHTCVKNCPAEILQITGRREAETLLESTSLDGFDQARYYRAAIKLIRQLNEDIREYTFSLLDPPRMSFCPGQFLLVEIEPDLKIYRAYTISGSNPNQSEVSITIKKLAGGYGSNIVFSNFKAGDRVNLKGPMGKELRIDPESRELYLIANGIGITPFVSAVQSFFDRKDIPFTGRATLVYGARYEEDLIYDHYLEAVAGRNGKLDYHKILSRPRTDRYPKGYVTDILKDLNPSPQARAYICGTTRMADSASRILIEKGLPEANIYYETFD